MIAGKLDQLRSALSEANYDEALSVANELILSPETESYHQNLIQTKLVCLLAVEKFAEALRVLHESPDPLFVTRNAYQHAYCLYKLGQLTESWALLQANKIAGDDKWSYLEAQISYKLDDFPRCTRIYEQMIRSANSQQSTEDGEYNELLVNYCASLASAGFAGLPIDETAVAITSKNVETFDFKYNLACLNVSKGEYLEAHDNLEDSLRILDAGVEGYSPADIESERNPIQLQLAIVKSIIADSHGDIAAKESIKSDFEHFVNTCSADEHFGVHITALSNLIRVSKPKSRKYLMEKYKLHQLLTSSPTPSPSSFAEARVKLAGWQVCRLRSNYASVLAHQGHNSRARHHYEKAYLACSTDDIATKFHLLFTARLKGVPNESSAKAVVEEIRAVISEFEHGKRKPSSVLVDFILNMFIQLPHPGKHADLIVSIIEGNGMKLGEEVVENALFAAKVADCLENMADRVVSTRTSDTSALTSTAGFLLKSNLAEKALDIAKSVLKSDEDNLSALSIALVSEFKLTRRIDSDTAERLAASVSTATEGDIKKSLDILSIIVPYSSVTKDEEGERKRRKRPMRHPPKSLAASGPNNSGGQQAKKIDPDRWLPRKQRASYKRKHQPSFNNQQSNSNSQKKGNNKNNKKKHGKRK